MRLLIVLELELVNVLKTCRSFRFIRKSVCCLQVASGHSFRTRDTWTFSNTVIEKINAMEMWCYRRILKTSWKEMISNEKVLDMIGRRKSSLQELIKRKMRFAGHIMRGSSGLLPRLVLEGKERKTEKNLGR